ncbi:MAG TPA: dephospho-CoA kinase [Gemmatimonadales bacterium]|nr:dephospho-CoA kinase [Gemmatimonadales bacterium]HRZ10089.1 dephospho-CoA kinase [Gemmatimonadales bacterium]
MIVALTGNIAAGKSSVVALFRQWGAGIVDADEVVRDLQRPGTEVFQQIVKRFGKSVLTPAGELDRPALRRLILEDTRARSDLNAIVHPAVRAQRDALVAAARAAGARIIVADIPLLFEAADPAEFDAVVLVDAPEAVRLHRLVTMRGLPREDAERLIAAQLPSDTKRPRSQFVIDNDGDRAQLERRARDVWLALEARAAAA